MRTIQIEARPLRIPFRTRVKHAAAERHASESVWAEASRDGVSGMGEGCPRGYVTGESVEGALAWIAEIAPALVSLAGAQELRAVVAEHAAEIDAHPAAWCAVETALLDLFGREENATVEECLGLEPVAGRFEYSAVVSDERGPALERLLDAYLAFGFADFKLKIGGNLVADLRKVERLHLLAAARGRAVRRVRLDANNVFAGKPEEALRHFDAFETPIFAVEEPLAPRDVEGLSRLSRELALPVVLDESLCCAADLERFDDAPGRFIANVRVSKHGGLVRTLALLEALRERGWPIVVGAQVGETSVLTRLGLVAARAAGDALVAQEGAFGTLLLERDLVAPVLQFGIGGVLHYAATELPFGAGLGLHKTEEILS